MTIHNNNLMSDVYHVHKLYINDQYVVVQHFPLLIEPEKFFVIHVNFRVIVLNSFSPAYVM